MAVHAVTASFETLQAQRRAQCHAVIAALPNYPIYAHYHGRPPLDPRAIYALKQQIADLEEQLRRTVNADWKACVMRYPQVLDHYFQLVEVGLPREVPGFGGLGGGGAVGAVGRVDAAADGRKKAKKRRDSGGTYIVSGRGKAPPIVPTPPVHPSYGGVGVYGYPFGGH